MSKSNQRKSFLLSALILSVLAFVAVAYFLASSLLKQGGWNGNMNGNELKIPALLEDQNPDPAITEYILDAQYGETGFFDGRQTN